MTAAADVGLWTPAPPGLTIRRPKLVLPSLRHSVLTIVAGPLYRALGPLAIANTKPFLPTNLPGLVLWLAADKISGLSDGDPVGTWLDASGQGNDASQATAAKKPTYKVSILNGKPVVRFDGVDDYMSHGLNHGGNPVTGLVVAQRRDGSATWQLLLQGSAANTSTALLMNTRTATSVNWGAYFSAEYYSSYSINNVFRVLALLVRSGTDVDFVTNGTVETKVTLGYYGGDAADRRVIGGIATSEYAAMDLAEGVVYDHALAAADRQRVESYLNAKYAIY